MKIYKLTRVVTVFFCMATLFAVAAFAKQQQQAGYILEHEKDIVKDEPAPHKTRSNSPIFLMAASNTFAD